jgi:hypothetical protein
MRNAYALLGVLFITVIGGALIGYEYSQQQDGASTAQQPSHGRNSASSTDVITNAGKQNHSMGELNITSPAFEHQGPIPAKYTCDGENSIPPLEIKGVPEEAQSLVIIMDDPDAPVGTFDHWSVYNMPARNTSVTEGESPEGTIGVNSAGGVEYMGPCPPDGEHRYFFKVFALDTQLDIDEGAPKPEIEAALEGHVIDQDELVGLYDRS